MNKENVADDQLNISQCITQSPNSVREYSYPIPLDLLIDIFSRVPAKSIARFRCVSKFWAYILRRPDFTELFLTKSFTRPRFLLSFYVNCKLFLFSAPQPQNPAENSYLVATPYKYFPKYFPTGISPPLCGLVFLCSRTQGKKPQVISNPVTGDSIILTKVKGTGEKQSFLGFDPINKEFKVLCMTLTLSRIFHTPRVFTLETGKRIWRTIQDPIFRHSPTIGAICINGVLYYGADYKGSSVIVCFDVRSENFGIVNQDEDMLREDIWTLFNYKDKLGAHGSVSWRNNEEFLLWVLEDARKHKWSKIICVLPPFWDKMIVDKKCMIVGMTGTGEIVFSPSNLLNPFYHIYYNVERNTFTRINIKGLEEFQNDSIYVSTFLDYVENMKFM